MTKIGSLYGSQHSINASMKVKFNVIINIFKLLWNYVCLVKDENKKTMPMMNTPAGRLMKCFLRDLYMVKFIIFLKILIYDYISFI